MTNSNIKNRIRESNCWYYTCFTLWKIITAGYDHCYPHTACASCTYTLLFVQQLLCKLFSLGCSWWLVSVSGFGGTEIAHYTYSTASGGLCKRCYTPTWGSDSCKDLTGRRVGSVTVSPKHTDSCHCATQRISWVCCCISYRKIHEDV